MGYARKKKTRRCQMPSTTPTSWNTMAAVTQERNGKRDPMHIGRMCQCHIKCAHTTRRKRIELKFNRQKFQSKAKREEVAELRKTWRNTFRANCTTELHTNARSFAGAKTQKRYPHLPVVQPCFPKSEPSATSKTPNHEFENAKRRTSTVDLLPTPKHFALLLLKMTWEPSHVI